MPLSKEERQERCNAYRRERMKDPAYRADKNAKWLAKYGAGTEGGKQRNEYYRTRRAADPQTFLERERRSKMARAYGISQSEFDVLLAEQGGCAICKSPEPRGKRTWHIDHNHETGVVRGILCHHCNTGIGLLGEDPDRIRSAASYLRAHAAIACKESGNVPKDNA